MKVMRMYVWRPKSISDYSDGVVCVIAESKHAAIDLAVDERFPFAACKRGMSASERAAVQRVNLDLAGERADFREELMQASPRAIRRGAIIEFGGG